MCSIILVKLAKRHNLKSKSTSALNVEILSSLHLTGRDIFYVVRCGHDVIAFVLTPNGASLMGRWNYDEWIKN
ncbi:MAG: hypothetical protein IJP69_05145 [Synergistaceae bacterium]|nr:hypothetical protein [Synergistaceae bacterium]